MRAFAVILTLLMSASPCVYGQAGRGPGALPQPRKKELDAAAEKLKKAQQEGTLDKARAAAEGLSKNLPASVTDAARQAMEDAATRQQAIDAAKSAASTLIPEAKRLLTNDAQAAPPKVEEAPPPVPAGPQPVPLQPLADPKPEASLPSIVIEANETVFDLKAAIFIYTGDVRARHPQFYIESEELEVHMVQESATQDTPPAPKSDPIRAHGKADPRQSGVKLAIARGPMVVIEKKDENGEVQQGRCKRAIYDARTGEITMTGLPQVQRGNILHMATTADTEMIFDAAGKLRTKGRPRTIILQKEDDGTSPVESPAPSPGNTR